MVKVKGSEPEQFFIFLTTRDGSKMRTSDFLSEEKLRSDLVIRGITDMEIEAVIERARSRTE